MIYVIYGFLIFTFLFVIIHVIMFIIFKKDYVPVLMYHRITDDKKQTDVRYIKHKGSILDLDSMKVSPSNFYDQMKYLYDNNYKVSSLDKDVFHKSGKNIYVTFDDGYKDNFTHAYPILKQFNQVGIFYITAKLIDDNAFMPIDLNDKRYANRLMTWDEVKVMANDNMQIGSHTLNHPWLTDSNVNLEEEIVLSKELIMDKSGVKVDTFAYPGGLYNENVINITRNNYKTAVITSRGIDFPNENKDVYLIERETISNSDNMFMFYLKVWGVHKFIRKLKWLNYLRGKIKCLLKR